MANAKAHRLAPGEAATDSPDRQLLERFVATRDEAAFTELVRRHGGTVWSVCRRVLGRPQDVEDAFQATFLVLFRKAAAIRKGDAVGSWLYAVAYRTAMKARQDLVQQQETVAHATPPAAEQAPANEAACRELQRLLDEQLQCLPEKYRAPFILCCLQGLSRTEAASELGWKEGTVSGRVARARTLLQRRLARRGVALSTALAAGALAQNAAAAPPVLLASTAHAITTKAALSPAAVALAESVLKGMTAFKLVGGIALLLTLVLGAAAALVTLDGKPAAAPPRAAAPVLPRPLREAHTFGKPVIPVLNPTDERVLTIAIARDGQRLVTAGAFWPRPGHVTIWDMVSGKPLASVRDIAPVRSVAFAPDGRTIATGDFQGMLRIRDGQSGRELAAAKAHEIGINGVAFSPDGRLLASAGLDNMVKLWDATTLQALKSFPGHTDWVFTVAFFGHGRAFVTAGRDGTVRIWDVDRGETQATIAAGQGVVEAVAISPDDRTIASASWGGTVKLWDAETRADQATLSVPGRSLLSVAFSPDGKRLAATSGDGKIYLWDVTTHQPLPTLEKHAGPVNAVAFTADGATLASGGWDGTAQLWDVATGKAAATFVVGSAQAPEIAALAYAPDGKAFAVARGDAVELRDAKNGAVLQRWADIAKIADKANDGSTRRSRVAAVNCLVFAADGTALFGGSEDGNIIVWDPTTGARSKGLQGHVSGVVALCCSPDGQTLASASRDQTIKTWEPASGREIASRSAAHKGKVNALAFTADGRQLASGGDDGAVHVWDAATGTARANLEGHTAPVRALAFAPDGTLASASDDATVRLWPPDRDVAACRILRAFGDRESALIFSPGGHSLVMGSARGALTVWDAVAGVPRQRIDQNTNPITALAFDATGEELLSGSGGAVMRYPGLPAPPEPPSEVLPEKLYHDFRAGGSSLSRLTLYYHIQDLKVPHRRLEGADAAAVTTADESGLRITLGAGQDKRGVWAKAPTPISGDFDISVSYDLMSTDTPRNGFGVGVVILLSSPAAERMAKLCRLVRPIEGEGYLADLTDGRNKGRRITTKFVPALTRAGQLRLVREGATLRYLVADAPSPSFREIHREEFGTHDVNEMKVMVTSHESPAAIDARLVDLRIRAGRFSFTKAPPTAVASAPPPPAELLPEKLYQDFRGAQRPQPLRLFGPDAEEVTRAESAGLRIALPANYKKRGVWVTPQAPVSGDFDITAGYELLAVEQPREGAGAGIVMLAKSAEDKRIAKLCRLLRVQEGERYLADITDSNFQPKPKITTKMVPTLARAGQLRFVREGSILRYLVAEAPDQEFREIHRAEFGSGDVTELKLVITNHESAAAVDARLIDLRIRAGRFSTVAAQPIAVSPRPAARPAAETSSPPAIVKHSEAGGQPADGLPVRSGRPWLMLAAGIFGLLAVAGLVAGLRSQGRRHRGQDRAASEPHAPILKATCGACGKNLKAPATRAGKTGKCPRCGEIVVLPGAAAPAPHNDHSIATTWRVAAAAGVLLFLAGSALFLMLPTIGGQPAFLNVPLGREAVAGVEESGFGNQEFDGRQQPFRWTDGRARLVIPLATDKPPRALLVHLPASRPASAPPATIQIVANERVLFQDEVPNGALDKTFDLDPALLGDKLTLDILSNTFVPQALPGSTSGDTRALGVRVGRVELLGPAE